MAPHKYSLAELRDMLADKVGAVAHKYAPRAKGAYTDKGLYFTLNPGREDRSVGSFWVHMSGPKVGKWVDKATGQHGDLIDLIALSLGLSNADAIREARRFLGLDRDTPEAAEQRRLAAAQVAEQRATEAQAQAQRADKARARAQAIFLSAPEGIGGTPVEAYLAGRAIDLRAMGRAPRSLRFAEACQYWHREIDPQTGEVFEVRESRPAMLAAICNAAGDTVAVHRTWLAPQPGGGWGKARITSPISGAALPVKKVLGDYRGGAIRLGNGIGPRGGYGAPLAHCPPGSRVFIAEGIETALSARVLRPEARVLAAVSLANMGAVTLPANVAEVVLITDADTHPQARAALDRAVQAHRAAGRAVRIWGSNRPGEDLNDALQRAKKQQEEQGKDGQGAEQ